MRRLDRLSSVSVLEALSGHGKTTLAAAWAGHRQVNGDRVVWITADGSWDDPAAFERGLEEAIAHCSGDGHGRTILVVDELDSISDPRVLDLLCAAVAHDDDLHLLACARMPHPLVSAARHARLDVNVISGDDMTITAEEVRLFAEAWGHDVNADRAMRLHDLVGGWLLPLRLVLDATPAWSTDLATEAALDFFELSVLPEILDEQAKAIAMRVALSSPVTTATIVASMESASHPVSDTAELLMRLQRVGVLQRVPGDGDRQWRMPTLVRLSLIAAFEREDPQGRLCSHRLIAESLHRAGGPIGAVLTHARSGEHWPLLSHLWGEHGLQLTIDHPQEAIEAYAALPEDAVAARPLLAVPRAVTGALKSHPDDVDRTTVARRYAAAVHTGRIDVASGEDVGELVGLVVAAMVARRDQGDLAGARDLANRLDRRVGVTRSRRGDVGPVAWFALQWGLTELCAGDLPRAVVLFDRAFVVAQAAGTDFIASHAAGLLALVHAVSGTTGDAHRWSQVQEGYDTGDQWLDRLVTLPARIARTMLAIDRLDDDEARRGLDDIGDGTVETELWPFIAAAATRHALVLGEPMAMLAHLEHLSALHGRHVRREDVARRVVDRCRADLLLALGEGNRAHRLITADGVTPWLQIPAARLHLMTGEPVQAGRIASAAAWDHETTVRERIELGMIEAAAAWAAGDQCAGATSLARVKELARHARILDAELLVPELVGDPVSSDEQPAPGPSRARRPYPEHVDLVQLSPRETAVLELMHDHESLAHIAKQLTVSVNTVKKQTVSIYAKLGVHDRGSALLAARRLDLARPVRTVGGRPDSQSSPRGPRADHHGTK